MSQRFTPGAIDYDGPMATHYPLGRALSPHSAETWRATLEPFVPQTRVFEDIPAVEDTIATFQTQDLALETHRRVEQQICGSLREFAERTRLRADSALAVLSDSEFESCQTALERVAADESEPVPVLETLDLLVFRSGPS